MDTSTLWSQRTTRGAARSGAAPLVGHCINDSTCIFAVAKFTVGTQQQVLDATMYLARDAASDISVERHINSRTLQGHLFRAA